MIKMIVNWYKVKKFELAMKAAFYEDLRKVIENQREIVPALQKMCIAIKDMSPEETRTALIKALAQIIHDNNQANN